MAYKLLGYVVWRACKWYVHEHLPSRRTAATVALVGAGAVAAAVGLRRRATA